MSEVQPTISVIVVSFNTRDLLRQCLLNLGAVAAGIRHETIVIDNGSQDGSAEMIEREFAGVNLISSSVNLGFAGANNLAFRQARGRYLVLLNSDAFPERDALQRAIDLMERHPRIAVGGGRLLCHDGSWQPSARQFPSPLNDLLCLSGLAARFPQSRFFGRADRTWADPAEPCDVDWVPGAFWIARREVIRQLGGFNEDYFLYYEEVDLCRRLKRAGYGVRYWPEIRVMHHGGESAKSLSTMRMSSFGSQLLLWRMRSGLIYYHRHHGGLTAWLVNRMEAWWHRARVLRNRLMPGNGAEAKIEESRTIVALLQQAWRETRGGRVSPPRPW